MVIDMDFLPHFHREVVAFEASARSVDLSTSVPSCPEWSMSDLVVHLGQVHRGVAGIITSRLTEPPAQVDLSAVQAPEDADLLDWFEEGARRLEEVFRSWDPSEHAWTWSEDRTVGFWVRMQTIEAAVHRWDAENAVGLPQPLDDELAADAIVQTFEVMAPARRAWNKALPGKGERFRFTDGARAWTVLFDGDDVRLVDGVGDVEVTASVSDLALFLWGRVPVDRLGVAGDRDVLDRYFSLVPSV